jgi:hypothetical protein
MAKYFNKKEYQDGSIISQVIVDLYNSNKCENVLFVRTPTTGNWLDKVLINAPNVTRIIYDTHKIPRFSFHKSSIIIEHRILEDVLRSKNKKFDLICADPFHEYSYSQSDLSLLSRYLTDGGVVVCHDCFPSSKSMAAPIYQPVGWNGETYVAFIEFAYHNPEWFYGLLKIDTGIGIISKLQLHLLHNQFNKEKQEQLLLLHREDGGDPYTYFHENSKDVMNIIEFY